MNWRCRLGLHDLDQGDVGRCTRGCGYRRHGVVMTAGWKKSVLPPSTSDRPRGLPPVEGHPVPGSLPKLPQSIFNFERDPRDRAGDALGWYCSQGHPIPGPPAPGAPRQPCGCPILPEPETVRAGGVDADRLDEPRYELHRRDGHVLGPLDWKATLYWVAAWRRVGVPARDIRVAPSPPLTASEQLRRTPAFRYDGPQPVRHLDLLP